MSTKIDNETGEVYDDFLDGEIITEKQAAGIELKHKETIQEAVPSAAQPLTPIVASKNKISLIQTLANKWNVDASKVMDTLKQTAFKQKDGVVVTNEQMMALLIVCNQYDLNPFLKQIYAYPDKGGIVPVVGMDGWAAIANRHPLFSGCEFKFSETMLTMNYAKPCPEWCEIYIYRKGFDRPIVVREYLDETYREPFKRDGKVTNGPWQTHTKRMLRHKTYIQGLRIALGLTGIYDEDEAERIIDITPTPKVANNGEQQAMDRLMG